MTDLPRALAAVLDYGTHAPGCARGGTVNGVPQGCDCGWAETEQWAGELAQQTEEPQ